MNRRQIYRAPIGLELTARINNKTEGIINDISVFGIGISAKDMPGTDETIEVSFEFQNIGLKFDNLQAIVVWGRNDLQRFGAKWVNLNERHKNLIKRLTPE